MPDEDSIRSALSEVPYPGFSRDIVSFGIVKGIGVEGGKVTVQLALQTKDPAIPSAIHRTVTEKLQSVDGVTEVDLDFDIQDPPSGPSEAGASLTGIPGVKRVIAVASGKGGVGKSTVSANLAAALSKLPGNPKVGVCDCDLYGPSISLMFGTDDRPMATAENE
ncbi:MAG: P-loop NTPase, partial [Verrucomicrobiota bacterium]